MGTYIFREENKTFKAETGACLELFRQGDRATLAALYQRYAREVAGFLGRGFTFTSHGRILRFQGFSQPFDVDSILQETFMRAFKKSVRSRYDGQRSYRTYLFAIARNLVIDELRRRRSEVADLVEERKDEVALTPEGNYLRKELAQRMHVFKAGLPEGDRRLFQLRFEEQQTQLGVAAQLTLSHMQVRTREQKLRRRLFGFLQACGWHPTH